MNYRCWDSHSFPIVTVKSAHSETNILERNLNYQDKVIKEFLHYIF